MLLIVLLSEALPASAARTLNGFSLENSLVPVNQIVSGGPPKDGIPAIDLPVFIAADSADFIREDDAILGFVDASGARAYPIHILNWHEVVNDVSGNDSLIVTWCPLCGSGMAFRVPGKEAFGVSGLLYNSDVLLYDRKSGSLWSQIMNKAISGERRGQSLQHVILDHMPWSAWRQAHPQTLVLMPPESRNVDYRLDPYAGYERSGRLFFPVSHRSRLLHPKERVLGVVIDGQAIAYPLRELQQTSGVVRERVGSRNLTIEYDKTADAARAIIAVDDSPDPEHVPAVTLYWFAWKAFHPETQVFRAKADEREKP